MTFDLRLRGSPLMVMRPVRTRESARRGPCGVVSALSPGQRPGVAAVRRPQVHGPVRAMLVIVRDVLGQDRPQVPRPGRGAQNDGELTPRRRPSRRFEWVAGMSGRIA